MAVIKWVGAALSAAMLAALPPSAGAQAYPDKPIRLIVPYPAGGGSDVMARAIAEKLTTALAVQIVVENRVGAGGNIAASVAAKAPADGYTLFFGAAGPLAVNPALYEKLPFDPVKDFMPIGLVGKMPLFLTVPVSLPVQSLKELIELAKARPGQLNYASSGIGGTTHLAMEVLKSQTGAGITHVPYKGTAAGVADMLGGSIQAIFDAWATTGPHVQAGKLRFLAVSTAGRSALEPQLPTVAESGFPGFDLYVWYGLMAPAGTPPEVIAKLSSETAKVMAQADLKERFARLGMEPMTSTPEQFATHLRAETAKWAKIVRDSGARAE
ncbi:MAG: tripartite tricarboxylate transporter substrate binding protein [Rubrivivax sp.]|jgi:tripartite-type tricarboxylate transporter receptor subunit TctC|nr:tripartite tricarboxylate transporter substrate binding protein [Rubrivivax sp.]MDP3612939.1 tripartite tricarboxylate transporter substrate binding protein [Rubrivivax sp.]